MRRRDTDPDVFDYKLLGLEGEMGVPPQTREAMRKVVEQFAAFVVEIDHIIDAHLHKNLYGDLTEEEAHRILQRYPTVQEGMQHISGITTEEEYPAQKWIVIQALLDKLHELKHCGEAQTISRADYQRLKRQLLEKLFKQFGCGLDLQNFHATIPLLQNMGMIAPHITSQELVYYCPIGRWY